MHIPLNAAAVASQSLWAVLRSDELTERVRLMFFTQLAKIYAFLIHTTHLGRGIRSHLPALLMCIHNECSLLHKQTIIRTWWYWWCIDGRLLDLVNVMPSTLL